MAPDWKFFRSKEEQHGYDAHKTVPGKIWHFLAHEDSALSFIADAIIVILLGKFVILPIFGIALGTAFPLVAVVSSSMDHNGGFDDWWQRHGAWYADRNITKEQFAEFPYTNGFNKGDVFVVKGTNFDDLEVGDVIVYSISSRPDPIIHRIVFIEENFVSTKGDANTNQLDFELEIMEQQLHGKAVARIPLIGWVKVAFVELTN